MIRRTCGVTLNDRKKSELRELLRLKPCNQSDDEEE